MHNISSREVSLFDLLLSHWKRSFAMVVGCVALAALITMLLPKRYESRMEVLVKNERADPTITPQEASAPAIRTELNEAQVNSEMQILQSRDLLRAVVEDTQLYRPFLKPGMNRPDAAVLDQAVRKFEKRLKVETLRKTNIIQVRYEGSSPELAARVVQDLADRYLAAHLFIHSSAGAYGFFSEETRKYKTQLTDAQTLASFFRRSNHLFDIGAQRTASVARLEEIRTKLSDLAASMQETQSRIAALQQARLQASERISTQQRVSANQAAIGELETKLADLENQRLALLVKYKPSDRVVVGVEAEMANTRKNLDAARSEQSSEDTTDINPLHQSLTAELAQTEISLRGLRSRKEALREQERNYLGALDRIDQMSIQLSNLEQAETDARNDYNLYTQRLEQSRLAEQMDQRKVANVALIEKPAPSQIPSFPSLPLNLALGALFGLCAATMFSYVHRGSANSNHVYEFESLNPIVRTSVHSVDASGD